MLRISDFFFLFWITFATWPPYGQLSVNAYCILVFHDCPESHLEPCNESLSIIPAKYPMQFELEALERRI